MAMQTITIMMIMIKIIIIINVMAIIMMQEALRTGRVFYFVWNLLIRTEACNLMWNTEKGSMGIGSRNTSMGHFVGISIWQTDLA